MILNIILTILVCFLIYFLKAQRFQFKRTIIGIVLKGILSTVKHSFKDKWETGFMTILKRKLSRKLNQPYFSQNGVVEYELDGKFYKIKVLRNIKNIKNVENIKKDDTKKNYFILDFKEGSGKVTNVTSQLAPWIGPEHNFHNSIFTPRDFGFDKLMVYFSVGDKMPVGCDDALPKLLKEE